ncbi:Ig-like domain-containing protein [Methanobrevibacter sp.]|uniref:Ig-like domain-containing protein n=1 Tax=Methanobrevibacter sp. TaxID=66852 RepID=UPI003865113B
MDNNKIIIILLCVIIAILIVGVAVFSEMAKEDSNLAIADKKINVGDSLVVKLTDSKGNAIAGQTINIKIKDKDGTVIDEDITTNSKGKATFKMEETGKYSVECKFNGNGQYSSSSAQGNVSVKKATTEEISEEKTSNYDSVSGLSDDGYSYYPDSGPAVDSVGQTREYAKANNMRYIPQTIDGMDAGVYAPYDSKAGCYHT